MKTINHDGEEFVLKSEIEAAFKDRISKLSNRAIQAEEQAATLQEQIDSQSGELSKISKLQEQISTLEESLQSAETKYSRVTMMSDLGFTDPEIRDALEWAYQRAGVETPLEDWIREIKESPETAPLVLRPHLSQAKPQEATVETREIQAQEIEPPPLMLPPKTNTGTKPAPVQSGDILKRAATDPEFYAQNREAIKKAWRSR